MKGFRFDPFLNNSEKCPICGSIFVEKLGKDTLIPEKPNRKCKICGHKWRCVPGAKF